MPSKNYKVTITKKEKLNSHVISVNDKMTLFRYRPINNHTIQQMLDHKLSLTRPDAFNDPYDTSFVVDVKRLATYFVDNLPRETLLDYSTKMNLNTTNLKKISEFWIKDLYKSNQKFLRELFIVACFSEKIDNEVMWAHYSDDGKGFALEYYYNDLIKLKDYHIQFVKDISVELLKQFPILSDSLEDFNHQDYSQYGIYKVIYTNSKYDGTDLLQNSIDIVIKNINNFNVTYLDLLKQYRDNNVNLYTPQNMKIMSDTIVFTKKKAWSYEKEWRMLLPNLLIDFANIQKQHYIVDLEIRPKAVYLGEFAEISTKVIIYNYCYTNGIQLFQMFSDLDNKTYRLNKREIKKDQMLKFLNEAK